MYLTNQVSLEKALYTDPIQYRALKNYSGYSHLSDLIQSHFTHKKNYIKDSYIYKTLINLISYWKEETNQILLDNCVVADIVEDSLIIFKSENELREITCLLEKINKFNITIQEQESAFIVTLLKIEK